MIAATAFGDYVLPSNFQMYFAVVFNINISMKLYGIFSTDPVINKYRQYTAINILKDQYY